MKIKKTKTDLAAVKPKKNLIITIAVVLGIMVLAAGVFVGLKTLFATETYYVLNTNVAARVKVNPEMMTKVEVSKGGAPKNALGIAQVTNGGVYTKTPLKAGDTLTPSNTGVTLDTSTGIPDDWVVTSFNISSSRAVGGQVSRGDYFDLIGVSDQGAKYIATNILALDVNYTTVQTNNSQGEKSLNEEIQYIVGAPSKEAAIIADATDGDFYKSLRVVLSPRSVLYKERNLKKLDGVFKADLKTPLSNLFEGTDSSFTAVLRDDNGRPVNEEYCKEGKIQPKELCDKLEEIKRPERDTNKENTVSPQDTIDNTQDTNTQTDSRGNNEDTVNDEQNN